MQYVRKLSKGDKVAVVSLLRDIVGNIPVDMNITVRRSRQSGVARATCPD